MQHLSVDWNEWTMDYFTKENVFKIQLFANPVSTCHSRCIWRLAVCAPAPDALAPPCWQFSKGKNCHKSRPSELLLKNWLKSPTTLWRACVSQLTTEDRTNVTIQIPCDISMTAGIWTSSHLGLLSQSPSWAQIPLSNCETDLGYIMTACNREINGVLLSHDVQVSVDVFPSMQETSCAKRQADLHQRVIWVFMEAQKLI